MSIILLQPVHKFFTIVASDSKIYDAIKTVTGYPVDYFEQSARR